MTHYPGIFDDKYGGMTDIGGIIKDAWAFGIIPETQTCKGWTPGQLQDLYDKVNAQWARYEFRVAKLPPDVRERHERIHREAVERARAQGWNPELGDDD